MADVACRICKHYDSDNQVCKHPDRDDTKCIFYYGRHKPDGYCQLFTSKTSNVREVGNAETENPTE